MFRYADNDSYDIIPRISHNRIDECPWHPSVTANDMWRVNDAYSAILEYLYKILLNNVNDTEIICAEPRCNVFRNYDDYDICCYMTVIDKYTDVITASEMIMSSNLTITLNALGHKNGCITSIDKVAHIAIEEYTDEFFTECIKRFVFR